MDILTHTQPTENTYTGFCLTKRQHKGQRERRDPPGLGRSQLSSLSTTGSLQHLKQKTFCACAFPHAKGSCLQRSRLITVLATEGRTVSSCPVLLARRGCARPVPDGDQRDSTTGNDCLPRAAAEDLKQLVWTPARHIKLHLGHL